MSKTVYVEENACIGCTLCTQIAPNTFAMNNEGKSEAKNPHGDSEAIIQQACDSCPVSSIKFKE